MKSKRLDYWVSGVMFARYVFRNPKRTPRIRGYHPMADLLSVGWRAYRRIRGKDWKISL